MVHVTEPNDEFGGHFGSKITTKGSASATDVAGMRNVLGRYSDLILSRGDSTPGHSYGKIAIIGSTGFLGPYIVASLLEKVAHVRIVCLNRSHDGEDRTTTALRMIMGYEPANLSRLQFLKADITQPDFGLGSPQAAILASQVDELIFSAWDSNWVKPLQHFDPFLKGILNAIAFCTSSPRRTRITFISSICAVGNWPIVHPTCPKIPEEIVSDSHCAMPHGYGESKSVAERLLAKANRTLGLPVNILRMGQIGGPSTCSARSWPRQGWLYSIMMISKELKHFPAGVQPLDWIPVDSLAAGVVSCIEKRRSAADVRVFNVVHPHPSAWKILYETLRHEFGLEAQLVSLPQWLSLIPRGQLKLFGFLNALEGGREHNMSFENAKAVQVLPAVRPITKDTLVSWLGAWNLERGAAKSRL